MIGVVLGVTVVILVVMVVVGSKRLRHPDQSSDQRDAARSAAEDSLSSRFYDLVDRPAGPDADEPVGGTNRRPDDDER